VIAPALDILTRLIAFDTTSRNSNLALIEWVEAFLRERGVASQRVPNGDGTKSNLYALIGPEVEGGVVLSGHTDVVPVDGQPWTSDPWTVVERGGKLYGRGVADMKTFAALTLAHVDAALAAPLKREGRSLRRLEGKGAARYRAKDLFRSLPPGLYQARLATAEGAASWTYPHVNASGPGR
jgi:acetylornithine deacetylase/succinyl-diaminopimelate desuccinylase-like protein